jgi:hypothetical protein
MVNASLTFTYGTPLAPSQQTLNPSFQIPIRIVLVTVRFGTVWGLLRLGRPYVHVQVPDATGLF